MFRDRLEMELKVTIGSTTVTVPGGNVRSLELDLFAWGFRGEIRFDRIGERVEDDLIAPFLTNDVATIELTVKSALPSHDEEATPCTCKAWVTEKALRETSVAEVSGAPVLTRSYTLRFADIAQVVWTQHRPLDLVAEKSIKDVLTTHLSSHGGIDVTHPAGTEARKHVCLPLGGSPASIYDFVAWWTDDNAGYFTYDYAAHRYVLADSKPDMSAPTKARGTDVASVQMVLPAPRRHAARVLNSYAEDPLTQDVAQQKAVSGISQDRLLRTAVSSDVDDWATVESARLGVRPPAMHVEFRKFPTFAFEPNRAIGLHDEYFSTEQQGVAASYRVREVHLRASTQSVEQTDLDTPSRTFQIELSMEWEASADPVGSLPPFTPPRWPLYAEGKVVCQTGEEGDRTYAFEEDSQTSLSYYRVNVPLWTCDVIAPFEPIYLPGHMYAPIYRDSRVMLALGLYTADITRHLDWGADVRLPAESQGNQVLFGKNAASQTAMRHEYVDSKPVFTLHRVADKDTELLEMKDGTLILQTKEES